jgi:hypothetical protein
MGFLIAKSLCGKKLFFPDFAQFYHARKFLSSAFCRFLTIFSTFFCSAQRIDCPGGRGDSNIIRPSVAIYVNGFPGLDRKAVSYRALRGLLWALLMEIALRKGLSYGGFHWELSTGYAQETLSL